ncbi:unnamed protein product [Tilletia controversa]|uniref:DUF895 domain membrane protein n=3 Tax=Tilletia TaxID=13289 RepID=A0A8X7MZ82_9BASI|nr:hypothetical protein CF336_g1086 [Tilletia laevis]KAE8204815.1 hypothetical protein CF328_g861 [Tilletia controversa]KAE8264812.1 hypothetical protein A4X03_0g684 [Tilletia caries]KAE8208195.1 hypothetical protein CF335_g596 [Tilletia laevis]KAE8254157.1 hypothetical protein A4X06_0g1038 [Tilletia controversa]
MAFPPPATSSSLPSSFATLATSSIIDSLSAFFTTRDPESANSHVPYTRLDAHDESEFEMAGQNETVLGNKSPASSIDEIREEEAVEALTPGAAYVLRTGKVKWYRGVPYNITVLGLCSFLAPGLWGAMAALGAGGSQKPQLVNAANSLTFCLMVVTSALTSTLIRLTSVRFALMFGTSGYAVYAAGLYLNKKAGVEWLVYLGAATCGISAGVFWSTEGAIGIGYPSRESLGRWVSYWLAWRVLGQIIGGAINLALNADASGAGSVSTNTYLVFIVLQALGPAAAFLLSPPAKVQRRDGSPVYLGIDNGTKDELKAMLKIFTKPQTLLILPLIFQTTFSESLTGTYAALHFSVRARALGSLLSAICAQLANFILGFLLDWQKATVNRRSRVAFISLYAFAGGIWIFAVKLMNEYHTTKPLLDWKDADFSRGFALYIMLQVMFNLLYEYTYFLVGAINDDPSELIRLTSIVRGVESAGQAVSYGINSTGFRLDAVAGINMGLWGICLLPAWIVVRKVGITADGTHVHSLRTVAPEDKRAQLKAAGVKTAAHDHGATDAKLLTAKND